MKRRKSLFWQQFANDEYSFKRRDWECRFGNVEQQSNYEYNFVSRNESDTVLAINGWFDPINICTGYACIAVIHR